MSAMTAQQILQSEVLGLPERLAQEALEFVRFLKERHEEEAFLWRKAQEELRYREQHPDEVFTVDADGWDAVVAGAEEEP